MLAPRGPEIQEPGFSWFRNIGIGNPVPERLDECLAQLAGWPRTRRHSWAWPCRWPRSGFSNGGMMAGALGSARPDLVDRVALLSSAYPLPPYVYDLGGLRGRRVLAIGGEDDPFLPRDIAIAGAAAYRAAGAEVTALTRPGGHGVGAEELDALRVFLGLAP